MKIVAIETSDFKGLKGYRDFDQIPDGIIGIVGDNGKGKSTLMSAVAYAFYGPEVLDTGNADVVAWGEREAWVNVWFMLDGQAYMLHRRTDGKNTKATLEREGEPLAQSATEVTAEMTELLGIDRVGFLASVFSRQEDLLGIGSLQPAKRASTVLRLLQFDRIEKALKNLSETGRDLNKEVGMWRLSGGKPVANIDYRTEIERAGDRIKSLNVKRDGYLLGIDAERDALRELEKRVEAYNDYAGKANTLSGVIKAAKQAQAEAIAEVDRLNIPEPVRPERWIEQDDFLIQENELKILRESQSKAVCPTCKRPYDAEEAINISNRITIMENLIRGNRPIYEDVVRYQKELETYERAVEQRKAAIVRAEGAKVRLDGAVGELESLPKVENPQGPYNAALKRRRELEVNLAGVDQMLATENNDIKHWTEALARYEEERQKYAETEYRIKQLERDILINGQTSLLMQQYKNNLIANVIPSISERASVLVTEMTEGKYTELALTPQYDIEYRNDNGELKSFANLSGGEKDIFALALRLAIADLKAGSIGILVLDEVLESLDPGRQEATWNALLKLTSRYNQVFVITHVDAFKDRASHTISV